MWAPATGKVWEKMGQSNIAGTIRLPEVEARRHHHHQHHYTVIIS